MKRPDFRRPQAERKIGNRRIAFTLKKVEADAFFLPTGITYNRKIKAFRVCLWAGNEPFIESYFSLADYGGRPDAALLDAWSVLESTLNLIPNPETPGPKPRTGVKGLWVSVQRPRLRNDRYLRVITEQALAHKPHCFVPVLNININEASQAILDRHLKLGIGMLRQHAYEREQADGLLPQEPVTKDTVSIHFLPVFLPREVRLADLLSPSKPA